MSDDLVKSKSKVAKVLGWSVITVALVVLGVPLVGQVLTLGMVVVKMAIAAVFIVGLLALGLWLIRR